MDLELNESRPVREKTATLLVLSIKNLSFLSRPWTMGHYIVSAFLGGKAVPSELSCGIMDRNTDYNVHTTKKGPLGCHEIILPVGMGKCNRKTLTNGLLY